MTSEVENILSGEVVRKEGTDKVIGVSTANLVADEKGEVPLSKQSAFQITPVQTPLPETVDYEEPTPEVTEELDLGPAQAAPVEPAAPAEPVVPETPFAAEAPVASAPVLPEAPAEVAEEVVPAEVATPAEEVAPAVGESDTITEAPVEVAAPTELGTVDFNSIIPNIPLVDERPQEEVAEESQEEAPVELPAMPEEIMAEAPTTVNNELFVSDQPTPAVAPAEEAVPNAEANPISSGLVEETLDITPQAPELPVAAEEPVLEGMDEPVNEEPLFPDMPELTPDEPAQDNGPIESVPDAGTPDAGTAEVSPEAQELPQGETLETLGIPGLDFTTEATPEEVGLEEEAPIEGIEVAPEGEETVNYGELSVNSEKLDEIIEKLNDISVSLEDIRSKFDISRDATMMQQTPVMDNVAPVVEQPVAPAQEMQAPVVEAPQAPAQQEEYVDALSQIPGYEDAGVDETPIRSGMFI